MPTITHIHIRIETSADLASIRSVEMEAFPTHAEADLVDRLREEGDSVLSLVAILDCEVIGHAMFSRMQAPRDSLGLGTSWGDGLRLAHRSCQFARRH